MITTLADPRSLPFDRRFAIVAVVSLLVINVLARAGLSLPHSILGEYLALGVLLGLSAFAAAAPREGLFVAIVLIPVGFPPSVPHTFTTSPSDYLFAGALVTLVAQFLRSPRWDAAALVAFAIPILVAGTTALAFAVNFSGFIDSEQIKLGIAELVGVGLASAIPLALVLGLRTLKDLENAVFAAVIALAIGIVAGLLGVFENVACRLGDDRVWFVLPSGRAGGLSGDPNLFGAQVAVLASLAVLWCLRTQRRATAALVVVGVLTATVVAFVGSRAAWSTFLVFAGIWVLCALWQGRMRLPAFICLVIVALTPTAWTTFPCPFSTETADLVLFSERNNDLAYFHRIGIDMEVAPTEARLREEFAELQARLEGSGAAAERRGHAADNAFFAAVGRALQGIASIVPLDASRQHLWRFSIDVWRTQPYSGTGPGGLQYLLPHGWRAHNTYLTTLAETGVLGLGGLLGGFALVLTLLAWRRRVFEDHSTTAIFLMLATVLVLLVAGSQDVIRQPLLWLAPGLLLVLCGAAIRETPETDRTLPRSP